MKKTVFVLFFLWNTGIQVNAMQQLGIKFIGIGTDLEQLKNIDDVVKEVCKFTYQRLENLQKASSLQPEDIVSLQKEITEVHQLLQEARQRSDEIKSQRKQDLELRNYFCNVFFIKSKSMYTLANLSIELLTKIYDSTPEFPHTNFMKLVNTGLLQTTSPSIESSMILDTDNIYPPYGWDCEKEPMCVFKKKFQLFRKKFYSELQKISENNISTNQEEINRYTTIVNTVQIIHTISNHYKIIRKNILNTKEVPIGVGENYGCYSSYMNNTLPWFIDSEEKQTILNRFEIFKQNFTKQIGRPFPITDIDLPIKSFKQIPITNIDLPIKSFKQKMIGCMKYCLGIMTVIAIVAGIAYKLRYQFNHIKFQFLRFARNFSLFNLRTVSSSASRS